MSANTGTEGIASNTREAFLQRFGCRVRALRESGGLRQADLASRVGMDRVSISQIERGLREVGVSKVPRLAEALGVTPSALFDTDS